MLDINVRLVNPHGENRTPQDRKAIRETWGGGCMEIELGLSSAEELHHWDTEFFFKAPWKDLEL